MSHFSNTGRNISQVLHGNALSCLKVHYWFIPLALLIHFSSKSLIFNQSLILETCYIFSPLPILYPKNKCATENFKNAKVVLVNNMCIASSHPNKPMAAMAKQCPGIINYRLVKVGKLHQSPALLCLLCLPHEIGGLSLAAALQGMRSSMALD